MSFLWCHALEPGKVGSFLFTRPLVIRNVSLGHKVCDTKSRTSVQIRYTESGEEKATFLCSLVPGKFEQFSLQVTLDAGVHYDAEVIGKNVVYLIGAYTEPDKPNTLEAPATIRSNMLLSLHPHPTTTSQDITPLEHLSPEPPTQVAVVEASTAIGKKKPGRSVGSKVNQVAPAGSRMATRSTVGTRSKVASKGALASSQSTPTRPALPMQDVSIIKPRPSQAPLPTIQSLAIAPAQSSQPPASLSPLKTQFDSVPPAPTDIPTTATSRMQWTNTLASLPSELVNRDYTFASSVFSTSLSNLQARTSSSQDILRVQTPPVHSSSVVHPTFRDPVTDSGSTPPQPAYVCVRDLKVGSGPLVWPQSIVYLRYRGKVGDTKGPVFAENVNGPPFKFRVGGPDVFPGFSDGIVGMVKGGKRTIFIPPAFGFGSQGNDKVPPNSPLVIECEVLDIDMASAL